MAKRTQRKIRGTTLEFPHAVKNLDEIPARRYYDQEFFDLECERLWPHVWQMACRLEEIPKRGDFVVYENLGQSIIVVRVDESTVKAYHNHCRHRGVKLAADRGNRPNGFTCPFHGWAWNVDGECSFVFGEELFDKRCLKGEDLRLIECRLETWGGCAFINLDDNAPPLRDMIKPFADKFDEWHADTLRTEWWYAAHLPVNWKLAMEAFMEGYHVMATHPQLVPLGVPRGRGATYGDPSRDLIKGSRYTTIAMQPSDVGPVESSKFIETMIRFMRILNEGMAGMTHIKDVRIAQGLRNTRLPKDPVGAAVTWRRKLNDAVMRWNRNADLDVADLNAIDEKNLDDSVNFCFPHFFLLPTFSSASSYRIRPLGPEECLFEIWSLTRFAAGEEPPAIKTPTPMRHDDPRWPLIPKQDFSNLPLQQEGLKTRGFEFMRLSDKVEGLISNYHQLIDGYLGGADPKKLRTAAQKVSGPIDAPIRKLGL